MPSYGKTHPTPGVCMRPRAADSNVLSLAFRFAPAPPLALLEAHTVIMPPLALGPRWDAASCVVDGRVIVVGGPTCRCPCCNRSLTPTPCPYPNPSRAAILGQALV